jgi:hypothetical protein
MGVTCRVVGFRTGVWNFVGAGLGFDLGLLDRNFLLGILECFGQLLFGMFSSGVIIVSFPCCHFFCFFFLDVSSLRGCVEIFADW